MSKEIEKKHHQTFKNHFVDHFSQVVQMVRVCC